MTKNNDKNSKNEDYLHLAQIIRETRKPRAPLMDPAHQNDNRDENAQTTLTDLVQNIRNSWNLYRETTKTSDKNSEH